MSLSASAAIEPGQRFVWLEDLIRANLPALFPGLEVVAAHAFRITRDAEVDIRELESADLLETVEEAVWRRRFRRVVRLQVDAACPADLRAILMDELEVQDEDVYASEGPLALTGLWQLHDLDLPRLKYRGFTRRRRPRSGSAPPTTSSRPSGAGIFSSTIPTNPSSQWWSSSGLPPVIPTSSRSR